MLKLFIQTTEDSGVKRQHYFHTLVSQTLNMGTQLLNKSKDGTTGELSFPINIHSQRKQ